MTEKPHHSYVEKLTWDRQANAAYLALVGQEPGPRRVARTLTVEDESGAVVAALDFAADGTLLGVELLDAATQLPDAMKAAATDITGAAGS
ncbi:DUF2283 domain-containing protein [Nocardia sp. X0981]